MLISPAYSVEESAPTNDIFTLDELKAELRISGTQDDVRLTRIVDAVQAALSGWLRRPIRKQVFYHYFDIPPCGSDDLVLDKTPIASVAAIESRNGTTWTAVPTTEYMVFRTWTSAAPPVQPTWIQPVSGWDLDTDELLDPFRVKTTSGWDPVPDVIRENAFRVAIDMYHNRSNYVSVEQYGVGSEVRQMIDLYRMPTGAIGLGPR